MLHLVTFTGTDVEDYAFHHYLAHVEAFGLHGAFQEFREKLLDKE